MLSAGDIVERHIAIKASISSAEYAYILNETGGKCTSLMPHEWPSVRRDMYRRVNVVSVFHSHLLAQILGS